MAFIASNLTYITFLLISHLKLVKIKVWGCFGFAKVIKIYIAYLGYASKNVEVKITGKNTNTIGVDSSTEQNVYSYVPASYSNYSSTLACY